MEVAVKRPPEKVVVLRQPSSPAAGSDSSPKPFGRPPVLPPKPSAAESQAVLAGPSPSIAGVVSLAVSDASQLDFDSCDELPPPPSEDELCTAAPGVPPSVSLSLGVKPDASASVASVAISRIASKYDTSANATRARLSGTTAFTTADQAPSLGGARLSTDPAGGGGSTSEATCALLASCAGSLELASQNAVSSDAAADCVGGGSPAIGRPTLPPPPPPPPNAVELPMPLLPAPPADFASSAVADDGLGSPSVRPDLLSSVAASFVVGRPIPEIASGQRSRASSTDSTLSFGKGRSGFSPRSSEPSDSPGAAIPVGSICAPISSTVKSSLSVRIASEASSRSCTPPVADGSAEVAPAVISTETVAVKLTQLKIENKRNKTVPRHDVAGDGKKVSFRVDSGSGGLRRSFESGSAGQRQQPMDEKRLNAGLGSGSAGMQQLLDEQRLRTGLSADEVMQAEVFYRSHKTEVRACQCMATLFFADVPPPVVPDSGSSVGSSVHVNVEDWKPAHIGIPLLVYDSGEGKRQRALSFVFAERGTGFQLWRNTMHWLTDYRPVESTFHQMSVGPPPAAPGRKKSSKAAGVAEQVEITCTMAGVAFQDSKCAEQFYEQYRQLVEWRPDDNILGDPNLKKKKKKKNGAASGVAATAAAAAAAGSRKQLLMPSKSAISQPVEFAHITQLKRSEDGLVLPTVCPTESYRMDDGAAIGAT